MRLRNTPERYGLVAMTLHWLIALLIFGMIGLGWYMTGLPVGVRKIQLYQLHKSLGITVLALVVLRLGWRLANRPPPLPDTIRGPERLLARVTHFGLYLLIVAMPLSGWIIASAATLPTSLYGLVPLPRLVAPDEATLHRAGAVHEVLAWAILVLAALHAAGAVKHHVIDKDNVLRRMLPVRLRPEPPAAAKEGRR